MSRSRKDHRGRKFLAVVVVLALIAGLGAYWYAGRDNPHGDVSKSSYRDIGAGVSVSEGAPKDLRAAVDETIEKPPFKQLTQLAPVVHVTPDGQLDQPVTLRFHLNRTIDDPRDVILAVNETGEKDGWTLIAPTKVEGEYAYFVTTHLSWWDPLWRSFTNLVDATLGELKRQFDGLTDGAFADAERPQCNGEQAARDKGYSIDWKGAEVLYWCLGLEDGKPIVRAVNKRRYPIFLNHRGISVTEKPSKIGFDWLAQQSFSNRRTVLLPFDEAKLSYSLNKGGSKSFTTEYNGFAEGLYQLQFGVETLLNILTRFGAGGGTIKNGAITMTQFDRVAEVMDKFMKAEQCADALHSDTPDAGAVISGCFDASLIADVFGWKGVLLAGVMVAAPVVNFFRNTFDTLGDLLQGKDKEKVTVSYDPLPPAKALFAGKWFVHGAQLVINRDGTGTYTWNAGPCTDADDSLMCAGHASIRFRVTGTDGMTGTYTKVWYTSETGAAPSGFTAGESGRTAGKTFTVKRNGDHTLITSDGTGSRPGNPYLCDEHAMQRNDREPYLLCGA